MRLHLLCLCLFVFFSTGCVKKQEPVIVDMDEYVFETAINTCRERAQSMLNDEPEPRRRSYFEQCMASQGYGRETYKNRWIIFY